MKWNKWLISVLMLVTVLVVAGCTSSNVTDEVEQATSNPVVEETISEEAVSDEQVEEAVTDEEPIAEDVSTVEEPAITDDKEITLGMLDPSAQLAKDQLAPDFALKTLDGEVVQLSDYRGNLVLLNFWTTW